MPIDAGSGMAPTFAAARPVRLGGAPEPPFPTLSSNVAAPVVRLIE